MSDWMFYASIIILIVNLFLFLPKKKYKKLNEDFQKYSAVKQKRKTFFAWTYIIGSVILFFVLLIGTSPG